MCAFLVCILFFVQRVQVGLCQHACLRLPACLHVCLCVVCECVCVRAQVSGLYYGLCTSCVGHVEEDVSGGQELAAGGEGGREGKEGVQQSV